MNILDIINRIRIEADDSTAQDYLWDDTTLLGLINDAVDEAVIRKRLIFDTTTSTVCQITANPPVSTPALPTVYSLDPSIIDISKAYLTDPDSSYPFPCGMFPTLEIVSREYLDMYFSWWPTWYGPPRFLLYEEGNVTIIPNVWETNTLNLEVYRITLAAEKMTLPSSGPEPLPVISAVHHPYLYHWPLSVLYNRRDLDQYAPQRAVYHLGKFEEYFGKRPPANQYRKDRQGRPHRNKVHL